MKLDAKVIGISSAAGLALFMITLSVFLMSKNALTLIVPVAAAL